MKRVELMIEREEGEKRHEVWGVFLFIFIHLSAALV